MILVWTMAGNCIWNTDISARILTLSCVTFTFFNLPLLRQGRKWPNNGLVGRLGQILPTWNFTTVLLTAGAIDSVIFRGRVCCFRRPHGKNLQIRTLREECDRRNTVEKYESAVWCTVGLILRSDHPTHILSEFSIYGDFSNERTVFIEKIFFLRNFFNFLTYNRIKSWDTG